MFKNLLKKLFQPKQTELLNPLASPQPNKVLQISPMRSAPKTPAVPVTPSTPYTPSATPAPFNQNGVNYGRNPSTKIASPEVRSAVESASKQYGVPSALLLDIAMQESSLNPGARNPEPGVTASGLFQINNPTWDTIHKYGSMPGNTLNLPSNDHMDPRTNASAAAYLIKHGQLGRWDASKNIWGKFWPDSELNGQGFYSQALKKVANAN